MFSRISKVHEREFAVLPKAWSRLHYAVGKASNLMLRTKHYPDFAALPEDKFEEFLKRSRLSESDKSQLRNRSPRERLSFYQEAMSWIELNDAGLAQQNFHNYLVEQSIFMTPELRKRFFAVDQVRSDALADYRTWLQYRHFGDPEVNKLFGASSTQVRALTPKIEAISEAVQLRLMVGEA
jgi:hypothetical protein